MLVDTVQVYTVYCKEECPCENHLEGVYVYIWVRPNMEVMSHILCFTRAHLECTWRSVVYKVMFIVFQ